MHRPLYGEQGLGVILLRKGLHETNHHGKGLARARDVCGDVPFVAWHSIAMVVAPAPSTSDLIKMLRTVLDPYLHFFRLDNDWNFFAPDVGEEGRDPLGVILRCDRG